MVALTRQSEKITAKKTLEDNVFLLLAPIRVLIFTNRMPKMAGEENFTFLVA